MAGPLRGGGGGVKGRAIKEKRTFLTFFLQRSKLEGGGGLGLNGTAIEGRTFFCGFPKHVNGLQSVSLKRFCRCTIF